MKNAYEVTSGVSGQVVRYSCAACNTALVNPLRRAGDQDTCPDCGTSHVVPGAQEKEQDSRRQIERAERRQEARVGREQATKEAMLTKAAEQTRKQKSVQLDRDPVREWAGYAAILVLVMAVAAGRQFISAVSTDSSGLSFAIFGLFFVGVWLNFSGIRRLRLEYVCAAECLRTMKQPSGFKELLSIPAAGVFHQHVKDLAAMARYDRSVSQDGLVGLLYSRMIAKSRIVEVLSGVLVTLGLIGTVIGLISMTEGLSETVNSLGDEGEAGGLLSGMRQTMAGLGTAFYTTLLGAFLGSVGLRVLNNVYVSNVEQLVSYIAATVEVQILPRLRARKEAVRAEAI